MFFRYLFRVFVLSPFLFKCYEETGVIGNNPAIVKELRQSLTAGWRAELTDLKNEQSSEPLLKSRSGGENPEGETPGGEATGGETSSGSTEKLGEKQMRLVEWHLADEPLKQFNAWVPPEADQQR